MNIKYELTGVPSNMVDLYYDYLKNPQLKKGKQAGALSTLFKLLKIAIGVGILAIPEGFQRIDLLGGILVIMMCGYIQYHSYSLLVNAIEEISCVKSNVVEFKNKKAQQMEMVSTDSFDSDEVQDRQQMDFLQQINPLIEAEIKKEFQTMNLVGAVRTVIPNNNRMAIFVQIITFLLMFGQNVGQFYFFYKSISVFRHQIYFIIPVALFTVSFSYVKQLEDLRIFTRIFQYLVFIILYGFSVIAIYELKVNDAQINYGINIKGFAHIFGLAAFAFAVNGVITEIRDEMQEPEKFRNCLKKYIIICGFVYAIFGSVCYRGYGDETSSLIIDNFYQTMRMINPFMQRVFQVLQFLYAVSVIYNLVLSDIIQYRLFELIPFPNKYRKLSKLLIRIIYISGCMISAEYLQSFSNFITFLGSSSSVVLGYIIPYYLHRQVFPNLEFRNKLINFIIVAIGAIGGLMGIVVAFL